MAERDVAQAAEEGTLQPSEYRRSVARLTAVYFDRASVGMGVRHQELSDRATQIAMIAADAVRLKSTSDNWEAVYDTWLARATCHSSMAACREGRG